MAKDFVKRNSARHNGSVSKQLLLVLVCFLLGYLSASITDLASLTSWVKTQLIAQQAAPSVKKPLTTQAQLPKPKFEFYTLLANENKDVVEPAVSAATTKTASAAIQTSPSLAPTNPTGTKNSPPVVTAAAVVAAAKSLPAPVVNSKDAYLVQVAAFKSRPEAEKMKASLVLKGFLVSIVVVNQQNTNWFRVSLGPFSSRPEAQRAQGAVARSEHIIGMIRKMDA